jgi:ABC-type bacteriocin/lantibiotic exporter with double-glycine peptidase domain
MAKPFSEKPPLKRLFNHLKLEKTDIRRLVILTICIGLLSLATPVAIQALINIVTMGGLLEPLYVVSFMLFLLLCLSGTLYVLERYIVELIQRRFFVRAAINAAHSAQSAKAEIHDHHNSAELMNRFFDVITVQKSAAALLTYGLSATLQAIIGSIVLMFYSFYFAIVVFVILFVLYFVVFKLGKLATQTAIQESKSKFKVAAWLEVLARNLITFKFQNGAKFGTYKAEKITNDYLQDRKDHFKTLLFQNITGGIIYAFAGTAMLALGGTLVIQGEINLGQFVAAELIIFSVLLSFRKFVEYLEYYYDLLAAIDKLGIIDDFPTETHGQHALDVTDGLKLEVKNLTFSYSPQSSLIQNLSFSLPAQGEICIYGESGTGKSTIAELMTGLRTTQHGQIEMNGINIQALNLEKVREHIGYVGQIEVIETSILENIQLNRAAFGIEKITSLLKAIHLYDAIFKLPAGLDTQLAPSGAPLSYQQTQLVMLARALLGEPKLVIIDELLDGLDTAQLTHVLSQLKAENRNYALIVLTRIETIANCFDNVIHLNNA